MSTSYVHKLMKKVLSRQSNPNNHFFDIIIILTFFFGLVNTISNYIIGLHTFANIWSAAITLFMIFIFFLVRQEKKLLKNIALYLYFISVLISINALWLYNGGSQSPSPLIFISLMALIVYLNPKPGATIISFIVGTNIIVLLIIEWQFPNLVVFYKNEQQRIMDHLVATFYLFAAVIPALAYERKLIIKEKEQAEDENKQKSAYLANMSHEIRTPMNAIVGFSELLQDQGINQKEQNEYIYIIRQNSELLLNLINNILDLSKLEANLVTIRKSTFCINSLLSQIYNAHINQAQKTDIHFEKDIPYEFRNAMIETDRTLLFQVFSNLIINALKATQKGVVRFGVRRKKDGLLFFVFDTGPGIPFDQQKKIFERFSQLPSNHNGKVNSEGVGLGLSICKEIIDLLGGEIKLHSEVNVGSTFIFSFSTNTLKYHGHQIQENENFETRNAEILRQ